MPLNWGFEIIKWKYLLKNNFKTTFEQSIKSVLIGISVGLWTPNRIGEIAGRSLIFQKKDKANIIALATISSLCQFIITLFVGLGGLFMIFYLTGKNLKLSVVYYIFVVIIFVLMIILIFNLKNIYNFCLKKNCFKKHLDKFSALQNLNNKPIINILLLSFLRYTVFSFQFYFLLLFFNVNINLIQSLSGISASYLFMNISPHILIADIGIRGSITIFFLELFSKNTSGIFLSAIAIWLINIVIPALIGQFFLLKNAKL